MARIFDENFRENGYSETWVEKADVGCTLNENMSTSAFTAGTTAPSTFYGRCLLVAADGDSSNVARISASFSTEHPITYTRFEFIVLSANFTDSATNNLIVVRCSASALLYLVNLRYTIAGGYHLNLQISNSAGSTSYYTGTVTFNTLHRIEILYDITNCSCICLFNDSNILTVSLTSAFVYNAKGIEVGNNGGVRTGQATYYFDNIRINDDSGTINNSWPGTSYDEPIREIDFLSTQRCIGMGL